MRELQRGGTSLAPLVPVLVLVAASVLWGLSWMPLRALERLGVIGLSMTALAAGAAGLALLPVAVRQRNSWRARWPFLGLIFLLGGYANLAFTLALVYGEIVRSMVLFYLLPAWGVLGGHWFLGEQVGLKRSFAVACALCGAVLVLGGPSALDGSLSWTDLLAISSGLTFAGSNLVFRAQQALPFASKAACMLLGSAVLALIGLGLGLQTQSSIPLQAVGWTCAYGVGWLLLATLGSQFGVTHLETGRSSIIIIIELLTAVASALLVNREVMSPMEIAGGILILTAAITEARQAN